MSATAELLALVQARLAEDPVHVREALTLIADPDALPAAPELSSHARRVNADRLQQAREAFFAGARRGEDVREQLGGISRQALHQRVRAGKLLALTAARTSWLPDWQFTATGEPVPGLDALLRELPTNPIAADRLVRTPVPEAGGQSLADLLANNELELAVHYARTAGGDR